MCLVKLGQKFGEKWPTERILNEKQFNSHDALFMTNTAMSRNTVENS